MRLVGVAAAACAALFALPAHAGPAPYAGETRSARSQFQLAGRDHRTWVVDVELTSRTPAGGAPAYLLTVALRRCVTSGSKVRCTRPDVYVTRPGAENASISDDLTTARVESMVGGLPLNLVWTASRRKL